MRWQEQAGPAVARASVERGPSEFWRISAQASSSPLALLEDLDHASSVEDGRENKGASLCLADAAV